MKTFYKALVVCLLAVTMSACEKNVSSAKVSQSQKASEAANSINFAENAEIDNIKKRLELTSNPGALGFVLLMNEMGQPVMYTSVKGKITSGGKRLTRPDEYSNHGTNGFMRQSSSDEGTYGSSDPYIYFWTAEGQYIQWNGKYLYSDKPFRVKIEPLVISGATQSAG